MLEQNNEIKPAWDQWRLILAQPQWELKAIKMMQKD